MPWSWANCSASQICGTMASASSGASFRACEQLPQAHAVHELHQQVVEPVGLAEVVDGDDVRVVQPGQRLGLAGEALGKLRVSATFSGARIFSATRRFSFGWRAL